MMKNFGLIGGTSWRSTVEYYSIINEQINSHFHNNTNPALHISSINQHQIHEYQKLGDWSAIAQLYIKKSIELENLGVEGIAFCANTPHKIYNAVQEAVSVPILHIADAIAKNLKLINVNTIGLMGTKFTMQEGFIKNKLLNDHGISSITPEDDEQVQIQTYLYEELSVGIFSETAKTYFQKVMSNLSLKGAEAIVLGCTEFPLLLKDYSSKIDLVDSLKCHCDLIVDFILEA